MYLIHNVDHILVILVNDQSSHISQNIVPNIYHKIPSIKWIEVTRDTNIYFIMRVDLRIS